MSTVTTGTAPELHRRDRVLVPRSRWGASTRAGTGCGGCKGRIAELIERFADLGDTAEVGV